MARTLREVHDSLKRTIQSLNPTVDLVVGPLYNNVVAPVAPEIVLIESAVERLQRYYSTNFEAAATPDEARNFAINFATGPSNGGYARGQITFYRRSLPLAGETYSVTVGSLVSTQDSTLMFRVITGVDLIGAYSATYYNPSNGRYEVMAFVEAVAPGTLYNIPVGRVVRLVSNLSGFDGVEQITNMTGGTEAEDISGTVSRVRAKFLGLDRNSVSGIVSTTKSAFPGLVLDMHVIRPTDRQEFRRVTDGPSIDLCIYGQRSSGFTEEYLGIGGETTINITVNRTVMSVDTVSIGGTALSSTDWTFIPDTSVELQGSTRANAKVHLANALSPGDIVSIVGAKNALLDDIQGMWASDENSLFKTDIMARSFVSLPVTTQIEARVSSVGDPDSIQATITSLVMAQIEADIIPDSIYPDFLASYIRGMIPEISSLKLLKFKRTYSSQSDVEPIIPLKNQRPTYDLVNSNIVVRA